MSIKYHVAQADISGNELRYLTECIETGWISSQGPFVNLFEQKFSELSNSKFSITTSNGTTSLHLALISLGVGVGDEVIVPSLTFAATINAVLHANAVPVIVDVDYETWCISPDKIKDALSSKTKAILPVHLYGQVANMNEISQIAKENNLLVVEDCAEALGATFNEKYVGTIGDVGCFSFFGNKIITSGEGGMCTVQNESLNKSIRKLRDHGMKRDHEIYYYHDEVGFNYRMTNLQAAIGVAQIERISSNLEARDYIKKYYDENLQKVVKPINVANSKSVCWLASYLVENKNNLMKKLRERGIDSRPFFYPLDKMDIYKKYSNYECEASYELYQKGISLPTYSNLKKEDLEYITDNFNECVS